jgi:hypothetical protein
MTEEEKQQDQASTDGMAPKPEADAAERQRLEEHINMEREAQLAQRDEAQRAHNTELEQANKAADEQARADYDARAKARDEASAIQRANMDEATAKAHQDALRARQAPDAEPAKSE